MGKKIYVGKKITDIGHDRQTHFHLNLFPVDVSTTQKCDANKHLKVSIMFKKKGNFNFHPVTVPS